MILTDLQNFWLMIQVFFLIISFHIFFAKKHVKKVVASNVKI